MAWTAAGSMGLRPPGGDWAETRRSASAGVGLTAEPKSTRCWKTVTVRIGLTAVAQRADRIVEHTLAAERDGFASMWFASSVAGDPLAAMAIAGRETERIELGTAVLQTFPCHPVLQANRAVAAADAMGRQGLTLGVGPSHESVVAGILGLDYDHPGRNTEEYLRILVPLLEGETVDFEGRDWTARSVTVPVDMHIPVLLAALGPRLLQIAGELADGVVLWMAPVGAIEKHVVPRLRAAAAGADRPEPRVVAGLPVAVHDDIEEARAATSMTSAGYENMPNYRRILALGGTQHAADAAILGDESSVTRQLQSLLDAGATDIQAFIVPVGDDRRTSIRRTRDLLASLAS
jgi:F420-dependent oxidoreductase-like protein